MEREQIESAKNIKAGAYAKMEKSQMSG